MRMIIIDGEIGASSSKTEGLTGGNLMLERKGVEAFILMNREYLNPEPKPQNQICYDHKLQIWVNKETGRSLVLQSFKNLPKKLCSDFGETNMTKTQEGADQTEVVGFSEFGETAITETREGADQTEVVGFSEFGETAIKETREGADQAEVIGFSEFAENYALTQKESDQPKICSLLATELNG